MTQEYLLYFKEKWCTTAEKDPLLGHADGFQIDPNLLRCAARPQGRQSQSGIFIIRFDSTACRWQIIGNAGTTLDAELRRQHEGNPIVQTIRQLLAESEDGKWSGSASQLMAAGQRLCRQHIAPTNQKLGLTLRKLDAALLDYDGIIHDGTAHGTAGRTHHFYFAHPLGWTTPRTSRSCFLCDRYLS